MAPRPQSPVTAANREDLDTNKKYRYLTPESIQALKDFQYNGADNSLLYKHILSPLAGFLVDNVTPSTIAPNSITLFGFSFMIFAFALIQRHCPTLDHCTAGIHDDREEVPRYIFLVNGVALLVYQTLDNMDGKQARKTGSSSPLGLFFDHGLDACNIFVGTVNTLCLFGIPSDDFFNIAVVTFLTALPFYITTWEEYYTHKLELPFINGPSEGIFMSAMSSLASWWGGQKIWHSHEVWDIIEPYIPSTVLQKLPYQNFWNSGLSNVDMLSVFLTVCVVREVFSKIVFVSWKYGISTLKGLAPMAALIVLSAVIVDHSPKVFIKHQIICLTIFGLIFVEMVSVSTVIILKHHCVGFMNRQSNMYAN